MAVIFNERDVAHETAGAGVTVQRLITPDRVGSDRVLTERRHLAPGAGCDFSVGAGDLAWAHVLAGAARLVADGRAYELGENHFVLLPPGLDARLESAGGTTVFRATVPDAARFDREWDPATLGLRCVDWTEEPVLNSEFDARKRIYMLTPKLSGTKVAKGEMILYPPGTEAADHHHEGAEHFQVILRGEATFHLDGTPHRVRAGDTIYIYDHERHYFLNDGVGELAFIEYFVPGSYRTVWAENAPVCTWNPTGRNIKGGVPAREIGAHTSADAHGRADV